MATSVTEAESSSTPKTRHGNVEARKSSNNEIPTPPSDDSHLAKSFKSDLTMMRGLVTCTICDQLLYEPWTLGCGHTYCYSCLCQWFKQHRHKMTCPDCRTAVKYIPAPSFTIKQMIEIFIGRVELLPPDETVEQHRENIRLERMAVEEDRATEDGLFKGCFQPSNRVRRQWMDNDGIWRCSGCHHEVEDREDDRCSHCQVLFEDMDSDEGPHYDDMDSFDGDRHEMYPYDMEVDMDEFDSDRTDDDDDLSSFYERHPSLNPEDHHPRNFFHAVAHRRRGHVLDLDDDDDEYDEDGESVGSLRDFIESEEPQVDRSSRAASENSRITISSDSDSDESVVPVRRNRRRPSINLLSSSSVDDSDDESLISGSHGFTNTDQHGQVESESEVFPYEYERYSPLEEDSDARTVTSNNSTVHGFDDENHFITRESSVTTHRRSSRASSMSSRYDNGTDNESENYDRDGDIEMSVSPDSRAAGSDSDNESEASDSSSRRTARYSSVDLGPAVEVHEEEDEDSDDSDESVRPRRRRRRLAFSGTSVANQDDEDVTLTQLFTRPPNGRRTSPTFDGQRILDWYASTRNSPTSPSSNHHPPRRAATTPSRITVEIQRRGDRTHRGVWSRNITR